MNESAEFFRKFDTICSRVSAPLKSLTQNHPELGGVCTDFEKLQDFVRNEAKGALFLGKRSPIRRSNSFDSESDSSQLGDDTWIKLIDESSGVAYYHNPHTKETTWAEPSKYILAMSTREYVEDVEPRDPKHKASDSVRTGSCLPTPRVMNRMVSGYALFGNGRKGSFIPGPPTDIKSPKKNRTPRIIKAPTRIPLVDNDRKWTRGALVEACKRGDVSWTKATDQESIKRVIDQPDEDEDTALTWAIRIGNPEVVRALLVAGSDPSQADSDGDTPLDIAKRVLTRFRVSRNGREQGMQEIISLLGGSKENKAPKQRTSIQCRTWNVMAGISVFFFLVVGVQRATMFLEQEGR